MAARQRDRDVVEAVGIRLEAQGHEQISEGTARAGDERDGEVVSPGLTQSRDRAPARAGAQHPVPGEPGELLGPEVAGTVEVGGDAAVKLEPGAFRDGGPQLGGFDLVGYPSRF